MGVVLLLAGIAGTIYFGFNWQSARQDLAEVEEMPFIGEDAVARYQTPVTRNLALGIVSLVGAGAGGVLLLQRKS